MNLYGINIKTVNDFTEEHFITFFPKRYERSKRYLNREDALRSLGAGILINSILKVSEKELEYNKYGKPFVCGKKEFNISHGGEYAVMVCDDKPIGVDIEPMKEENLYIAPKVFTNEELDWMQEEPLLRFHILWTLKESVLKAIGFGFALEPSSFSVLPFDKPIIIDKKEIYTAWIVRDNCVISVSSEKKISSLAFEEIFRKDIE